MDTRKRKAIRLAAKSPKPVKAFHRRQSSKTENSEQDVIGELQQKLSELKEKLNETLERREEMVTVRSTIKAPDEVMRELESLKARHHTLVQAMQSQQEIWKSDEITLKKLQKEAEILKCVEVNEEVFDSSSEVTEAQNQLKALKEEEVQLQAKLVSKRQEARLKEIKLKELKCYLKSYAP